MKYEEWLRTECFQEPTEEAYELARAAFKAGYSNGRAAVNCIKFDAIFHHDGDFCWLTESLIKDGDCPCKEIKPHSTALAELGRELCLKKRHRIKDWAENRHIDKKTVSEAFTEIGISYSVD
jgi:hypothetical protein